MMFEIALGLVVGYLAGSIPFGLLLSKIAGLGDIRTIGSGNIGATNVLRTGNKSVALATLILDALKAALPILAFSHMEHAGFAAALGAFLGHVFPVWLKFHGGKGIAVYLGASLALSPLAGFVFVASWIASAVIWRTSSLSALIACVITPIALAVLGQPNGAFVFTLMSALAFWAHRDNIKRIRSGTESRIGQKSD